MKKSFLKAGLLLLFILLTACMLIYNKEALSLTLTGLTLWFEKMIPALLPFMILSGILIRLGLSDSFARLFSPVLRPLFSLSDSCIYVIVIGFLCGFPMGARVCAESYQRGKISKKEASLLLAFCNNIGPVYFTGYVLHLFSVKYPLFFFAGMYLIPLFYGILLRYTMYRDIPRCHTKSGKQPLPLIGVKELLLSTDEAILAALSSITALGGYMILFNLLYMLPSLFFKQAPFLQLLSGCLLEITSGLARLPENYAFYAFILLPFGGFSCIAQTYNMIRDTDLSLNHYIFHKIIQTVFSFSYYTVLFHFL